MTLLLHAAVGRAADVNLIVWVRDGMQFVSSSLRAEKRTFERDRPDLVHRVLSIDEELTHTTVSRLKKVLGEGDRVVNLVVGTHGSTCVAENASKLANFGAFGPAGPSGPFKDLLEHLEDRGALGDQLHVTLIACSTLEGEPEKAIERAAGLLRVIRASGVERASVWGATMPMATVKWRETPRHRRFWKMMSHPYLVTLTVSGLIGKIVLLGWTAAELALPVLRPGSGIWLAMHPLAALVILLRRRYYLESGGEGLLVVDHGEGPIVREVDIVAEPRLAGFGDCGPALSDQPPVISL